jgi:hypothetical protein
MILALAGAEKKINFVVGDNMKRIKETYERPKGKFEANI